MQDLHIADRPGLALHRVTPRMLSSIRINRISLIVPGARMLRNTVLRMALDTAP